MLLALKLGFCGLGTCKSLLLTKSLCWLWTKTGCGRYLTLLDICLAVFRFAEAELAKDDISWVWGSAIKQVICDGLPFRELHCAWHCNGRSHFLICSNPLSWRYRFWADFWVLLCPLYFWSTKQSPGSFVYHFFALGPQLTDCNSSFLLRKATGVYSASSDWNYEIKATNEISSGLFVSKLKPYQ